MYRFRWLAQIDWLLVVAALGLAAIGIDAIDAATEPALGAGPVERQLVWAGIGVVAMIVAAWPSTARVKPLAYAALALSIPLLVAVFWSEPINGARRWLRLGPIGIQPSELAKLAFVAALARFLVRSENCERWRVLVVPAALAAVPMALVLKQPDLGTALVFAPVLFAMLLAAGVSWRCLAVLAMVGVIALPVLWKSMSPFQRDRVTSFLDQRDTGRRPRDNGYQLYQSKLMVALGGDTGSSDAAEVHLPFDHTDFIFSVVAGRWGLAGATTLLALFGVVLWRGFAIAARTDELFGRLLAVGLVMLLAAQGIINLAMAVGLLPITGLTLPFVSYGGSSLVASFIAVGLLLSVGRHEGRDLVGVVLIR